MSERENNPGDVGGQARVSKGDPTPSGGGLSARQAADAIAGMLDEEGRAPGHVDPDKGRRSNREESDSDFDDDDEDHYEDDQGDDRQQRKQDREDADDDDEDYGDDEDQDDNDADTDTLNTVSDVAEELGLDVDELLGALSHSFKASGEEMTVTLAELVKGYQKDADYRKNTAALADARRTFDVEQQTREQGLHQQATLHAQQLNMVEQFFAQQLQSPELQALRSTNPAEWAAQSREIEGQIGVLRQQREQAAGQYQQYFDTQRNEFIRRESEILKRDIEGWGREKLEEAVDTIKTFGFGDDELMSVIDHRFIKAALEIKKLRNEKKVFEARLKKAGKTAKRVKENVPKAPKPGKRRNGRAVIERGKLATAKRRLRKSSKLGGRHNLKDAASVIEQLI